MSGSSQLITCCLVVPLRLRSVLVQISFKQSCKMAPTVFTETSAYSLGGVVAVGLIAYTGSKIFLPKNARWQDRYTFIWLVNLFALILTTFLYINTSSPSLFRLLMPLYISFLKALSYGCQFSDVKLTLRLVRLHRCVS